MLVTIKCEDCGKSFLAFGQTTWQCVAGKPGFLRKLAGHKFSYTPIPVPTLPGTLDELLPEEHKGKDMLQLQEEGVIVTAARCWCLTCSKAFDAIPANEQQTGNCPRCGIPGVTIACLIGSPCPCCGKGPVMRQIAGIV